jgi:pyridoxine 5-phosphate synthase
MAEKEIGMVMTAPIQNEKFAHDGNATLGTTALSINLNKIALIRNSRDTEYPSVVEHAQMCIDAGADGITVHPRPDQRHIRARDCMDLAAMLSVEFNIEGNPFAGPQRSNRPTVGDYPGFMALVGALKPAQCTLVPDSDAQLTSDHGFDLTRSADRLAPIVEQLQRWGVRVSLFMDADLTQIELARQLGVERIELYTGPYAQAFATGDNLQEVFQTFYRAAEKAAELGIGLNAGHDLNLLNLPRFATLPRLLEVSIGHAFTVDAIKMGLANAVTAYQRCLGKAL